MLVRSSFAWSSAARAPWTCAFASPVSPAALERHAQLGLGPANLAARFLARGLRDLEAAHRDRAGIFAVEAFLAVGVALGHLSIGLGHLQRGARALDAGMRRFDGVAREVVGGLGALQRDLVRHGIDVEERLSGLHLVVVADVNLHDLARRLGCDRHHEALDAGLRGGRRQPVADEVEDEADQDQRSDDRGALARAASGGGIGGRSRRGVGVLVHGVSVYGGGWESSAAGSGASSSRFQRLRSAITARVSSSTIGIERPGCHPPPIAL